MSATPHTADSQSISPQKQARLQAQCDRGLYILAINLEKGCKIKPGRLPEATLSPGFFLYIGRAKQRLSARLKRHMRQEKKAFWHIDYLLSSSQILEIWLNIGFFDECHVARAIFSGCQEASFPIPGFGSSDCRCPSHLLQVLKEDNSWRKVLKTMNFKKAGHHGHQT